MSGRRYVTVSHESERWGESTIGVSNALSSMLDSGTTKSHQLRDQSPFVTSSIKLSVAIIRSDVLSYISSHVIVINFTVTFHSGGEEKKILIEQAFNVSRGDNCASFQNVSFGTILGVTYLFVIAERLCRKFAPIPNPKTKLCSRLTPLQTHSLLYTFFFMATLSVAEWVRSGDALWWLLSAK